MSDERVRLAAVLSDRYRLDRELGAGGMATVYLAEDLKHSRQVAIKVLHPDLGAALGGDRFLAEIRTTAKLQHPHILPLLDSGDAGNGLLYYVMPFVRGETLRARLEREQQLPIADAVRIAREVADALQHAHAQGIVHRDIKPENILLQDGHALVADFGIALAVQSAGGQRLTQTGLSLGTPQYMSPEQAMGERTVDARSDIYALGAVTYEMLAGEPPFTGPTIQAIVARLLAEEPRPIVATRKTVPAHIDRTVLQALAKLPADRFASAAAFAQGLVGSSTEQHHALARRAVGSSRWTWPVVMVLAVVAAIWGTTAWLRPSRVGADTGAGTYRYSLDLSSSPNDVFSSLAISNDGATLAYTLVDSAGGRALWLRRLHSLSEQRIRGTEGARDPFWSPDDKAVAYFQGTRLFRLDVRTLRSTVIADVGEVRTTGTWMDDGGIILSARLSPALERIPPGGGAPAPYVALDSSARETTLLFPRRVGTSNQFTFLATAPADSSSVMTLWLAEASSPRAKRIRKLAQFNELYDYVGKGNIRLVSGYLLTLENSEILARKVDPRTLAPTGDPQVVVGGETTWTFDASPSGVLVYQGTRVIGTRRLVVLDRNGKVLRQVGERAEGGDFDFFGPRFSPDGRRLAFEHHEGRPSGDLFVFDETSGRLARQTVDELHHNGFPAWSPDGSSLVFHSTRNDGLWLKRGDGPPATPVPIGRTAGFPTDWSPDGRTILFGAQLTGVDVWRTSPDGRDVAPVLDGPANEMQATFSPDGRFIAYASDEQGDRLEIFVRRWPVTAEKWRVSTKGGEAPRWRRDGRELFYIQHEAGDARSALMSVDVAGGSSTFQSGAPRALFTTQLMIQLAMLRAAVQYDVAPDGSRFAMVVMDEARSATAPRAGVYVNWMRAIAGGRAGGDP